MLYSFCIYLKHNQYFLPAYAFIAAGYIWINVLILFRLYLRKQNGQVVLPSHPSTTLFLCAPLFFPFYCYFESLLFFLYFYNIFLISALFFVPNLGYLLYCPLSLDTSRPAQSSPSISELSIDSSIGYNSRRFALESLRYGIYNYY